MSTSPVAAVPERAPLPVVAPDVGAVEVAAGGRPVLARIADVADARDRLAGQLVADLAAAAAEDLAVSATRLSLQVWVEQVCRVTSAEARRLLADVDVLARMPAVRDGLADGRLSWSHTRQVCAAARTVPVARHAQLDAIVAGLLDEYRTYGPDELVGRVWQLVDGWQPSRLQRLEAATQRDEFLALQPDLEGGGSVYGRFGPESMSIIGEALDAPLGPPVGRPDPDDPDAAEAAVDELEDRRRWLARRHGSRLARRFVALCEDTLAGSDQAGSRVPPRPMAYVVTTLDALCDRDRTPGWLLHTLTGGRMRATTHLINQMIDRRGADTRLLVFDDHGTTIGVGHRTRTPPGWLRETIWVQHLTDTAPGGTTPVRRCDLDHIVAWPTGPTDVANLQPIGRTAHNDKTHRHLTVHRTPDATTTWTDHRTGLTTRRPPPWKPPDHDPPDP